MYKLSLQGTILTPPRLSENNCFVKKQFLIKDLNGVKLAPEIHPANFKKTEGLKAGDRVYLECHLNVNKKENAHFLVVDEVVKIKELKTELV